MIAKVEIKRCPFRKETFLLSSQTAFQNMSLGDHYSEEFMECIEEDCMAWHDKKCLLMRDPEEKKEKK